MVKLDKKDRQILYELDRNARQPLSKIAKKVSLSRESILYRLKRYHKEGIIRNYLTIINTSRLGYTHHKVYVKLHNITNEEEKEMIDSLIRNQNISWVSSCDGKYSLIYAPKAKSMFELHKIIMDIHNKYGRFIKESDTTTIVQAQYFYRDYLIDKKATTERVIEWGGKPVDIKLDKIDITILKELSKNSRVRATEIATKLKISADTIIKRIKNLEKAHIIEHYMIWPDVSKLQGIFFKVLITLNNMNQQKEKQLIEYCLNKKNIIYMVNCLGPWQLEIDIEVKNIEEFRELMREFMNNFSGIVSDYSTLTIWEEYKYRFIDESS